MRKRRARRGGTDREVQRRVCKAAELCGPGESEDDPIDVRTEEWCARGNMMRLRRVYRNRVYVLCQHVANHSVVDKRKKTDSSCLSRNYVSTGTTC